MVMTWVRRSGGTRVVLALYLLAALTLGFVHRRPAFEPPAAPIDLAAYALPGDALPLVCTTQTSAGKRGPAQAQMLCEACALASAPALTPSTADMLFGLHSGAPAALSAAPEACVSTTEPDNVRSRAPPMQPLLKV